MQGYHSLSIGTIIRNQNQGRYIVEALLGEGGYGAVYLVREQNNNGALFALKEIIHPNKRVRDRIAFEGEVLKRLEHPALPRIYKAYCIVEEEEENNRTYLLMDYIKGANLEWLRQQQPEGRIPLLRVLTIMAPIVDAIAYLHKQQPPIIHRDIKPENIIVPASSDEAVLVDFGLAKEYVPDRTTTIFRQGTPGYAAPEQYVGGTCPQTDIYGFGATLYTLLTGVVPADALLRLAEDKDIDTLVPANQILASIPVFVASDINRAMALSRKERFSTIEEFWQTFRNHATQYKESTHEFVSDELPVMKDLVEQSASNTIKAKLSANLHRRSRVHFAILLLVLIAAWTGFWMYIGVLHHTTPGHNLNPTSVASSVAVLTPTARLIPYPLVARQYAGTIGDIVANTKTNMSLINVQQNESNISGYFMGLGLKGPFKGSIDSSGHILFQVAIYSGSSTLSFEGTIKLGGDIAGSYRVMNQNNEFTGENGVWSATPTAPV